MRILIVEDEAIAARRLERLTREILGSSATQVDIHESLAGAEEFLSKNEVDLLLLDLNLYGRNGFDLIKEFSAASFQTIVVSANTDQALAAFEYGVLDFVPKPIEKERLSTALGRLNTATRHAGGSTRYLSVRNHGAIELIDVSHVLFLKGAGDYVEIHQTGGRMDLHSKSLESLEQLLPPHFVRVHKSYIIDIRERKRIIVHGGGKYELELNSGLLVPLSRTKYKELTTEKVAE